MLIYKIFRPNEWDNLCATGHTQGAPIDVSDGYIHFSTAAQVKETAQKHFSNAGDLILVACDANQFDGALKWEKSRGDQDFPHLYRSLHLSDVTWHQPLPQKNGHHCFPTDLK